ncbi:hypothetical protein H5410_011248 [Solanum commersonii]|uniref:Wall-associated receptor kinase galacturonan-binding domain-containing protein n=1 Tax=Solanum commersonii TaxID=4109 RepID=A0A9J6AN42_SOLCO|nr:hypothetical protein H5410_011248 [Solanum commersonii]
MINALVLFLFLFPFACVSSSSPNNCPKCGIMDVPYPLSTSDNCGNPNYKIYCKNETLEFLSSVGFYYKILNINPHTSRLIISPPFINKHSCQSSDLSLGGFKIDENSPFNISSRNTVMLFNCSENILLSPLNCSSSSPCRRFEEANEGRNCKNTLCCSYLKDTSMTSHRIRIRDQGCTAYISFVDFKAEESINAWRYGIELQWIPPNN